LFHLISSVGPACVIGSFALYLMTWPDIDVSVQLPHETDISTFFNLAQEIANQFQAAKMTFSNQFIRPDVPFDYGLYWGMRLLYAGRTWKVDLWRYGKDVYQANLQAFNELQSQLQNADRMAILRIKNEACRRPQYRSEISSVEIYKAVAERQIQTVEEFDEWRLMRAGQAEAANPDSATTLGRTRSKKGVSE